MEANTLVWVKLEDYPWWPALVVDKSSLGDVAIPDGSDTAVYFLGTGETGFVTSSNETQIVVFDDDEQKLNTDDESCKAAIAEAMGYYRQATAVDDGQLNNTQDDNNDSASDQEPTEEKSRKDRKEKKDKKDKKSKKEKKEKKDKKDKKRSRDDDEDVQRIQLEEEDKHHRKKSSLSLRKEKKKDTESLRQTDLHEYTAQPSASASNSKLVLSSKRDAIDSELIDFAKSINQLKSSHDQHGIRCILSKLTSVNVSLKQLQKTKIGVAVGSLLSGEFPACKMLASAILKYWFHRLPDSCKKQLRTEDEVDRASIASLEGDDEMGQQEMSTLDNLGIQLERCFTAAEIEEATGETDASHIAKLIENAIQLVASTARDLPPVVDPASPLTPKAASGGESSALYLFVLAFLRGENQSTMRKELLAGTMKPEAFLELMVKMMSDERSAHTATADDIKEELEATRAEEENYDNISTLYKCPECQTSKVTLTEHMLGGGHGEENAVRLLLTCVHCKHSWTE